MFQIFVTRTLLYLFYQVINDLLDPTGQNLRVREDAQVSILPIVLSSFHISFSAISCMFSIWEWFNYLFKSSPQLDDHVNSDDCPCQTFASDNFD